MTARASRFLMACMLLAAALLFAGSAQAAPPAPKAPADVSISPSAVGPIAVQDILARASEEQLQVEFARQLLAGPQPFERLRRGLDEIAAPVDAKQRNASGAVLRGLPIMRLESLARHWQFDAKRFARWEAVARRAFAPYEQTALQLAQRRLAWSATRAAGLLDGLPPVMSERVDAMLEQIDASETALGVALERQFELSQRASTLKARIHSGASDVAAAIEDIDQRLLRIDVPPLWQNLNLNTNQRSAVDVMHRGLEIESQFARDYNAAGTVNQQALRFVQVMLLPIIIWLVYRGRRGVTPNDAAVGALRRPFSAWLLLAMLSVLVFEPDAPLLVQEFALALALVPVLRLLPSNTAAWLGASPYVAVVLYALDRLGVAAVADVGIYRLFLLALNLLALGLTVWMLRQQPTLPADCGPVLQWPRRLLDWLVLVMLAVAVVCNVTGNVSLAETLTSGVIDSGYMALMLYAGVVACQGLLRVILSQPQLAGQQLLHRQGPVLQAVFNRVLVLGAVIGWLLYSLHRFRLLRPLQGASATVLGAGIDVGEVSVHIGDVLVFLFASWLAVWIAGAVRRLLREELPGHSKLPA